MEREKRREAEIYKILLKCTIKSSFCSYRINLTALVKRRQTGTCKHENEHVTGFLY